MKISVICFSKLMCQCLILLKVLLVTWLSLFVCSCGFQLNTNNNLLPNNAKSIEIIDFKNSTYEPFLGSQLKKGTQLLFEKQTGIFVGEEGDLKLEAEIINFQIRKIRHSLTSQQNFEFLFSVKLLISLLDKRNSENLYLNESIENTFSFRTSLNKLSQFEKDNGKKILVKQTSENLFKKITQFF